MYIRTEHIQNLRHVASCGPEKKCVANPWNAYIQAARHVIHPIWPDRSSSNSILRVGRFTSLPLSFFALPPPLQAQIQRTRLKCEMVTHALLEPSHYVATIRGETQVVAHDDPRQRDPDIHHRERFSNAIVRSDGEGRRGFWFFDQVRRAGPTFGDELRRAGINLFVCVGSWIRQTGKYRWWLFPYKRNPLLTSSDDILWGHDLRSACHKSAADHRTFGWSHSSRVAGIRGKQAEGFPNYTVQQFDAGDLVVGYFGIG